MNFIADLKRRNVFKVGIAYLVMGWILVQVTALAVPALGMPDVINTIIFYLLMTGFPVALLLAWAFEMTPDGIKRQQDNERQDRSPERAGRRLDFMIIGALAIAVGLLLYDRQTQVAEEPGGDVTVQDQRITIAVLPFSDMSAAGDQEYFGDGISEELLNVLMGVKGLRVSSRTSSFAFKGRNLSAPEIASALAVDHILEGSIRSQGNRVRITAQLIDVRTDSHLWSDTFDRNLDDIFAIQDEIANAIVRALSGTLGLEGENEVISVGIATENMEAYEAYLKGHGLFADRRNLLDSVAFFERAVTLDPGFARAWEGLAAVYAVLPSWGFIERPYGNLALEAAAKAIALNPRASLATAVIGNMMTVGPPSQWEEGMEHFRLAIEMDPNNVNAYLWRAIAYQNMGFMDRTASDIDRCLLVDPDYKNCQSLKGSLYLLRGEFELGLKNYVINLENNVSSTGEEVVSALALGGQHTAALLAARHATGNSGAPINEWVAAVENPADINATYREKLERWVEREDVDLTQLRPMLLAFRAYDLFDSTGTEFYAIWMLEFPEFRRSPDFKRIVIETGLRDYWYRHEFPPQCRPLGENDFECD